MTIILKISGADASQSPYGKLIRYNAAGFPLDGLRAIYTFAEGAVGAAYAGPFNDSSGNENHATIFSGRAPPIRRSYGLEVADTHGLILQTPIQMPRKHTIVAALRTNMATGAVEGYPTIFGDVGMGIPLDKTLAHSTTTGPSAGRCIPTMDLSGGNDRWGLFSSLNPFAGSGRLSMSQTFGKASDPQAFAFGFDNDTGAALFTSKSGGQIGGTYPVLAGVMNGNSSNVVLGLWPNGTARPVTGEIYCFAVYDIVLSDAARQVAIDAAAAIAVARGVIILGA